MRRNWWNALVVGMTLAVVAKGTPWWIAFPVALAAGLVSGRVEVLLARRAERQMSEATP